MTRKVGLVCYFFYYTYCKLYSPRLVSYTVFSILLKLFSYSLLDSLYLCAATLLILEILL